MPRATVDAADDVRPSTPVSGPSCDCDSCKLARFDRTGKLKRTVVHTYSHQPARWKFYDVARDTTGIPYHLGVELETDNASRRVENAYAADMRLPKTFWIAKADGSVSGPEFASHPATLAWWHAHREDLDKMFLMLLHGGFRSNDGDHCGMHVNIEKTAFVDSSHLYRFLTLLHSAPGWSQRMSQRTTRSLTWARMDDMNTAARRRERSQNGNGGARYVALNMPDGPVGRGGNLSSYHASHTDTGRFEFRLPRGTLRLDRFYKNLEWTVSMIEFSRSVPVKDCRPAAYMAWLMVQPEALYGNVQAFIREKDMMSGNKATAKVPARRVRRDPRMASVRRAEEQRRREAAAQRDMERIQAEARRERERLQREGRLTDAVAQYPEFRRLSAAYTEASDASQRDPYDATLQQDFVAADNEYCDFMESINGWGVDWAEVERLYNAQHTIVTA